jgi:signal peptidase I
LPGDIIKMQDFILYVKPQGAEEYVIEFELSAKSYEINRESLEGFYPPTWQENFPLSGDFAEIKLANDEYFVLGDNRVFSSDSRSWGPIPFDNILSKVIFRYWPFERFGSF